MLLSALNYKVLTPTPKATDDTVYLVARGISIKRDITFRISKFSCYFS